MKVKFMKRFGAYFIDVILLMLVVSIISPIIPKSADTNALSKETTAVVEDFANKKLDQKEFIKKTNDLSYDLARATYLESVVSIICYLLYFVVMPLFTKGQTLGKKLMKIKIVNNDGSEVGTNGLLFRGLILYGILSSIITLILLLVTSKSTYIGTSGNITALFGLINIVSFVMILVRKDGRGIHDLLGNTKVISIEEGDVA